MLLLIIFSAENTLQTSRVGSAGHKDLLSNMSLNASSASVAPLIYQCSAVKARLYILLPVSVVKAVLIVPLCTFILLHGVLRRRRSVRRRSHSDVFTYHLSVMEFMWFFGVIIFFCGERSNNMPVLLTGICMSTVNFYGEIFFHVLTCVERYLAAVHSITYRGLRAAHAVRIRNVSVLAVWLLCGFIVTIYGVFRHSQATVTFFCVLPLSVIVVSFCSLAVLRVLNRPGPGGSERVDRSKRRAFHTILSILSVLWLWFLGLLVVTALQRSGAFHENVGCMLASSIGVFNLPSSLVLPLLYLHRRRKLPCVGSNRE